MTRRLAVAMTLAVALLSPTASGQSFPRFTDHVVDQAGVVPDDVEDQVNAVLADYQDRTSNQVAIAVIATTGRMSIEDYANDLFEEWGVGERDEDNGALLVIAMEDRELRIEVGFGLEGDLTDLESGRIIRDHITPRLRKGDVGEAVFIAQQEIRRALDDTEIDAPPPAVPDPDGDGTGGVPNALGWLLPLFFFGVLPALGRRRGSRRRGWVTPIFWGGGWGGLGGRGGGGFGGGGFGGGGGGGSGGGGASGSW